MIQRGKVVSFLLLSFSGVVNAQQNSVVYDSIKEKVIDEVVVTATRTEKKISELPIPVTVVTRQELEKTNAVILTEILNEQTGLITMHGHPKGEGLQMQGLDSEYILILIDGVPVVGKTNGTLDLERINVGNVDRIEIVKGASSSLYGNEALGGVVNIITKNPDKKGFNGNLRYRYSTLNMHDVSAEGSYKTKGIGITGFVNRHSTSGYNVNDKTILGSVRPYAAYTYGLKVLSDISSKDKLTFSGRFYDYSQDNVGGKSKGYIKDWGALVQYERRFNDKLKTFLELNATRHYAFSKSIKGNKKGGEFKNLLLRPELRTSYQFNKKSNLIVGAGLTHEELDKVYIADTPNFTSPFLYFQYDTKLTPTTNVIAGARYDMHNRYKSQLSPKLAVKQDINKKIAVKASVGYGYKAPSFSMLYYNFHNIQSGYAVLGYNVVADKVEEMVANGEIENILVPLSTFRDNPLKPESSIAYNLGVNFQPTKKLKFDVNFYRNDIKNLINIVVVAQKPLNINYASRNIFSYRNVNKVYTQGVEFNGKYKLNRNFNFRGGYQLLYAFNKNNVGKKGYFGLSNRSRHMANFKVFYTNIQHGFNANIRGTYRSKYGVSDSNGNYYLDDKDTFVDGYIITDFAINKTFYKNYNISFGVNNLFDFQDIQYISNIPGRIYYGAIKIKF